MSEGEETYSSELGHQLGELGSLVVGDTLKVKDMLGKARTDLRLPNSDFLELLR